MKRIKCVVVGSADSEKIGLIGTYGRNEYFDEYIPTIENQTHILNINNTQVKFDIIDAVSYEDFKDFRIFAYTGTDVIVAVFHIAKPKTLDDIEKIWIPELSEHCPGKPIILAASCCEYLDDTSKVDPSQGERIITDDEVNNLLERFPMIYKYIKFSARKMRNVSNVFDAAVNVAMSDAVNPVRFRKVERIALAIGDFKELPLKYDDKDFVVATTDDLIRIRDKVSILIVVFNSKKSLTRSLGEIDTLYKPPDKFEQSFLVRVNNSESIDDLMSIDIKNAKRKLCTDTLIEIDSSWDWARLKKRILNRSYDAVDQNNECIVA